MMNNQGGGMQGQRPGGGGAPPPMKKEPIKLNLQGKERGFYSSMYDMAAKGADKVGGKEAVMFFGKSGLPMDKMKSIWNISARSNIAFVTRDEFYLALRLIAYHQNGITADENSLKINIDVALPQFNLSDPSN